MPKSPFPTVACQAFALLLAGALPAVAQAPAGTAAAPPATASTVAAPAGTSSSAATPEGQLTRDQKFAARELTKIPNELGAKLPWSIPMDDPANQALFPLAITKENPYWYTLGPDEFIVFKYPKSEPFRERTGRFIKPPGDSHWVYLVAEDDVNYFYQNMPPGEAFSAQNYVRSKTEKIAAQREAFRKEQEAKAAPKAEPGQEGKKPQNLDDLLGVEGYRLDEKYHSVEPPTVDVLSFRDSSTGLPDQGLWQMNTALGDLNGDGKLDIIAPPPRKAVGAQPLIWLGDGKGGWQLWNAPRWPADVVFDYGDVGLADFDGDGKLDIAFAMHFKGVVVLFGDGKGDFTHFHRFFDGSGFSSRALAIADFDGDKHPDIALLSELNMDPKTRAGVIGRMLRVFLYRGRDKKWEPRDQGTTPHLIGDQLATADFNHDKKPDLACSSHVHGKTSLLHLNRGEKGWEIWKARLLNDCYFWGVAGGDVNGDGWDDVVLSFVLIERGPDRERGGIAVFYNDKKGGLSAPQIVLLEERSIPHPFVKLADLDKDGRLDIVSCSYEGRFRILLQRKKGEFFQELSPEIPEMTGQNATIRDINGDGYLDMVVNFSSEAKGGALRCFLGGKADPSRPAVAPAPAKSPASPPEPGDRPGTK
jgi:hypothetical protein